jgi:hypothetical protein
MEKTQGLKVTLPNLVDDAIIEHLFEDDKPKLSQ